MKFSVCSRSQDISINSVFSGRGKEMFFCFCLLLPPSPPKEETKLNIRIKSTKFTVWRYIIQCKHLHSPLPPLLELYSSQSCKQLLKLHSDNENKNKNGGLSHLFPYQVLYSFSDHILYFNVVNLVMFAQQFCNWGFSYSWRTKYTNFDWLKEKEIKMCFPYLSRLGCPNIGNKMND